MGYDYDLHMKTSIEVIMNYDPILKENEKRTLMYMYSGNNSILEDKNQFYTIILWI